MSFTSGRAREREQAIIAPLITVLENLGKVIFHCLILNRAIARFSGYATIVNNVVVLIVIHCLSYRLVARQRQCNSTRCSCLQEMSPSVKRRNLHLMG